MLNSKEILDTINMIDQQHLDIRTITMGISLLDCADPDARPPAARSTTRSAAGRKSWSLPASPLSGSSAFPSSTSASPLPPSPWWRAPL